MIELDGSPSASLGQGITAVDCTVRGLAINGFTTDRFITDGGLHYFGAAGIVSAGSNTVIEGCTIGTDPTGTYARPNRNGLWVGGAGSRVGSDGDGNHDVAERNIVSGNLELGVRAVGSGIVVAGNYIGIDASGTQALGNGRGVEIGGAPSAPGVAPTLLGVSGHRPNPAAMRNVISGNTRSGIDSWGNPYELVIAGNDIGTNASGTAPLGNASQGGAGLTLGDNTLVGSDGDGVGDEFERNVVSGNPLYGIIAFGSHNRIAGIYIGTDPTGTFAVSYQPWGISLWGGHDNVVGIDDSHPVANPTSQRDVISGNNWGVEIRSGASRNVVAGNFFGTDATGTVPLPNDTAGISITGGSHNRIGTDSDGDDDDLERNIISNNHGAEVSFRGEGNDYNVVAGNYIGLDVTGRRAFGNGGFGHVANGGVAFYLTSGVGNRIGVDGTSANPASGRNIISSTRADGARQSNGIMLSDSAARETGSGTTLSGTIIAGNFIGTDVTGRHITDPGADGIHDTADDLPLGGRNGVWIVWQVVRDTRIGTDGNGLGDEFEGNVVGGFGSPLFHNSVVFEGGAGSALVAGNWIGTNAHGDDLGRSGSGIALLDSNSDIQIGGPGPLGNTIAFNLVGVSVRGSSTRNAIRGNWIHSND